MNKDFKVAFPTNDRENIEGHFGHCKEFAIFSVADGNVEGVEFKASPEHTPGSFPKFVASIGANVLIAGGMGKKASDILTENGVEVILGVSGSMSENLDKFIAGNLNSSYELCNNHHDHSHGEGHNCNH